MVKNFKFLTVYIFLLIAFVLGVVVRTAPMGAFAATSSVLEDLRRDSEFDSNDYPEIATDYSLQVIQIAENVADELIIYVYQPSGAACELKGTSINIARQADNGSGLGFNNYKLELLDSSGVFYKYKAVDFELSADSVRNYNISSIMRAWQSGIDDEAGSGNTISEVPYRVAQFWTATTAGDSVTYSMTQSDVVEITDKYVGFLRYRSGYWYLWGDATDSHYVAFSCDYDIDRLYDADVYFVQNSVHNRHSVFVGDRYTRGEDEEKTVTLTDIDKGEVIITGPFGEHHDWERIQSAAEFINTESDLSEEAKAAIQSKQWVLRFTETIYEKTITDTVGNYTEDYTEVSNVMILRLHFEVDGQVYNLGVVDNKQTGSGFPDNIGGREDCGNVSIWWIVAAIAIVIVLQLIFPWILTAIINILIVVIKYIGKGLLYLLKGIWWLITLPFRGIAALFKSSGKKE